jgi:predicted dehydrogenase
MNRVVKLKILIIGFGSIGKRHFEILKTFANVSEIDVVTKQSIFDVSTYKELRDVKNLDVYDYFVIASETIKHYTQLEYICSKVKRKKILVEKPLFNKNYPSINTSNIIFTAYNLRFHPILQKIRELIKTEQVYYVNVICGQYLPSWRPNQDYRTSYSADLAQGGGVLRDLSHEIDYIMWLFGEIDSIDSINVKISDLEINSDDLFTAIAITKYKTVINLSIDYISKYPIRRLIIHTKNTTIEADVINKKIDIYDKKEKKKSITMGNIDRNYTYSNMHYSILNNDFVRACSFNEGKKVVELIDNVNFMEL